MKRFLILIVLLAVLICGKGEVAAKKEEACVCKEGEKNCPCLAQQPKIKKAEVKVTVKAKVEFPQLTKKQILKRLSELKLKKIAPKEKAKLAKLKVDIKAIKAKVKSLKGKISQMQPEEKVTLLIAKKEYKNKCAVIKKAILATKAKLAEMEKNFKEECLKQAAEKEIKANKIIKELEPKVKTIKAKIKENLETIKVAPKTDVAFLQGKNLELEKNMKKLSDKLNKAKAFIINLQVAKQKGEERKQKKEEEELKKKVEKGAKMLFKIKQHKKQLSLNLNKLIIKIKPVKAVLQSKTAKEIVKKNKAKELKSLNQKINLEKAKLDKLIIKEAEIKKKLKEATARIAKIKTILKENKEKKECLKLQKKLTEELLKMKKLKADFEKECVKAVKTQKEKHISKVLSIKKQIDIVKAKIEGIKKAIKKAPHNQRKKLVEKVKELEKILKEKIEKLEKSKGKLTELKKMGKGKTKLEHKMLEKKKVKLIAKVAKTKKEIINYEKQTKLLKLKHEQACAEALAKEKEKSREAIEEITYKLNLGQKHADNLKKALSNTQEIADLTGKAESFKQQALETTDPKLKADLIKQEADLKLKLAKAKKELEANKREAKAIKHELEQKTKIEIIKEQKLAKKAEKETERLMKASLSRVQSIETELKKSADKAVKDALSAELKLEKNKLKEFNLKVQEFLEEKTALEHEMDLQEKSAAQRKSERELQDAIMAKQTKNQETILRSALSLKFDKDMKEKISSQKAVLEKDLDEYKKKLQIAQAEYTTYKVALKAGGKKKLLDILGQIKKKAEENLERLEKELKEVKLEGHMMKLSLEKIHSDKLHSLDRKLLAESRAKQLAIKKQIQKETSKGEAALKAAQMNSQEEIKREKEIAKNKISKLEKEIEKIKKRAMKEKMALEKDIMNAQTHSDELSTILDLEKKNSKQREKEIVDWKKEEEKTLKTKLGKIKAEETAGVKDLEKLIAAEKAKMKKDETALIAKLKAANAEISTNKKALDKENVNYKKLTQEMETYIATQTKKNKSELEKAIEKRKKEEKLHKEKLAKCEKSIEKEKKSLKALKADFEKKMEEVKKMNLIEEKRVAARNTLEDYEVKLLSLRANSLDIQSQINDTCADESSDDTAATCNRLRSDQAKVLKDIEGAKQQVADSRDAYLKI